MFCTVSEWLPQCYRSVQAERTVLLDWCKIMMPPFHVTLTRLCTGSICFRERCCFGVPKTDPLFHTMATRVGSARLLVLD